MIWQKREHDTEKEQEYLKMGHSKLLSRLLSQREPIDLKADYDSLSHPHALNGIKEAADIFCKVALKHQNCAVLSDFDVDGLTSATMIKELCNVFKMECTVVLPSRTLHGYGLTDKIIETLKTTVKEPPDLIFILDCGSSSEDKIKVLKELYPNTKIIILDHHIIEPNNISKSADVLINWHLSEGSVEMCTCGEVFQFIRGIRWLTKKVDPISFLSLSALGTIADVSPITGDNRIIVKNGLKEYALSHVTASGLNALLRKSDIYTKSITQEDVGYKIAPKINSAGRLFKPDLAYKLLTEHNHTTAELMADKLTKCNNKRKKIQKEAEKEAMAIVTKDPDKYKFGIALYNKNWNLGVLGLIAGHLTNKLYKPCLIVGDNEGILRGSGRAIGNINLKEVLDDCKDMFINYGGHALAAGITVKNECIDSLNDIFNKACERYFEKNGHPKEIRYYDAKIKPELLSMKTAKMLLDNLYPYCQQFNPEPVFLLSGVTVKNTKYIEGDGWNLLMFNVEGGEFRLKTFSDKIGGEIDGCKVDLYISFPQCLEKNRYGEAYCNVVDMVKHNV